MKKISILFLAGIVLVSCHKEINTPTKKNQVTEQAVKSDLELFGEEMSAEQKAFMESSPKVDLDLLNQILKQTDNGGTKTTQVWGVGTTKRVFKWNGVSWDEPNPAAGLDYIDVSDDGTAVWGISNTHIYRWNGTSWDEPNSAAGLYSISALNSQVAIGIGGSGIPFITLNGGSSWNYLGTMNSLKVLKISNNSLSGLKCVGIRYWGTAAAYVAFYDASTNTWFNQPTAYAPLYVDCATPTSGSGTKFVYSPYSSNGYGVLYHNTIGNASSSEYTNNVSMNLNHFGINSTGTEIWGILNQHIYKSINSGTTWTEPNTAALLKQVSVGGN